MESRIVSNLLKDLFCQSRFLELKFCRSLVISLNYIARFLFIYKDPLHCRTMLEPIQHIHHYLISNELKMS